MSSSYIFEVANYASGFYINLPVGGLAAVIITFVPIPDAKTKPKLSIAMLRRVLRNLDLPGFALFIPPSVMFLLALQFGSGDEFAWSSPTIIGLFCGAAASLVIFIFWERHVGNRAMLPGSLMKQRIVWVSCIFGSCNICSMIVASNWLPTYFQAVKGDNPFDSGVHILPSILAQLLLVVVGGALSQYHLSLSRSGADDSSFSSRILSSMGACWSYLHGSRTRSCIHVLIFNQRGKMGWISDNHGRCSRCKFADGTCSGTEPSVAKRISGCDGYAHDIPKFDCLSHECRQ